MTVHRKTLALHIKAAAASDDAVLAKVNTYTLRPFAADELQIREYVLAHNCIDRDDECFDESLLDDFARTLPGKGVHIRHPQSWDGDSGPGEGKVFDARTETMTIEQLRELVGEPALRLPPDRTQAKVLFANGYFARTPDNAALLIKQDAGIAGDVSVGFSATSREPITDAQGNELTARRWKGPGSAYEMSLVWLGAQPGARAVKSARTSPEPDPTQESTMTKEEIEALQKSLQTANTHLATAQKAAGQLDALKSALGDHAPLLDDTKALVGLVKDGKAFKAALVDDAVSLERQLGMVGDGEDAVKDAKAFLGEFDVNRLQAHIKGLEKRLPPGGHIKGAHPSQRAPGKEAAPSADSIAANAAL